MGQRVPLHVRFLHIFHLGIGRFVAAHEHDLEILLVRIPELDETRGERPAGRAPMSGKVKTHGLARQFVPGDFFARRVEQLLGKHFRQARFQLSFDRLLLAR